MSEEKTTHNHLNWLKTVRIPKKSVFSLFVGLAVVVVLAFFFPRGQSVEIDYKLGSIWGEKDLIAPFSFPVLRDEVEYEREVEEAERRVYPVFEPDSVSAGRQVQTLERFFETLGRAVAARAAHRSRLRRGNPPASDDSANYERLRGQLDVRFSDREWVVLDSLSARGRLETMRTILVERLRGYLQAGVLDRNKNTLPRTEVAIRSGTVEEIVPTSRLYDLSDIVGMLERDLLTQYGGDNAESAIAYKSGITHAAPTLVFSNTATDQALSAAADAVPRTIGYVQENERIVSRHERITVETKLKLDSYRRARADRGPATGGPTLWFGAALHVAGILLLFAIYLSLFRKRITGNPRRLTLVALLLIAPGFIAYILREMNVAGPVQFLIPVPAVSMLLTILFDSRVGFYGTVTMALIVAGVVGNDYAVALASVVAGALSVYSVRDMKNRTQIFRSLGFIFLGYAVSIVALALERYEAFPVIVEHLGFALGNAVLSPVLTYGFLVFLERSFRVTTDLTLIELAQFNHPLLRLLAEKAPGTYHHSLTMATLAEAAAAAVGANEVLARVGAYFHDIGKMIKPTYFVENQKGSRNRHDKLAPRMSSLIIAAHVKEGIALAREYRLPDEVVEFIPMHHGTTRIDYFYNKAVELAQSSDDETKIDEINDQDYRYSGPRPRTKETGIMMLADALEAAVRTIDEPTPQRIQDMIDGFVKRRLDEGELDECPLTMSDLTKIKAAFLNVLVGIYHSRVKYPDPERMRPRRSPRVSELAARGSSETPASPKPRGGGTR